MKSIIFLCFTALLCFGCADSGNNELQIPQQSTAIKIKPVLGTGTRAAQNYSATDYFTIKGYENASIASDKYMSIFNYVPSGFYFTSNSALVRFPDDGTALSILTFQWPEYSIREQGHIKDQWNMTEFLKADWLIGRMQNVAPVEMVSMELNHQFALITFVLKGANSGKKITSLSCAGYNAYCADDPEIKDAVFVYDPSEKTLVSGASGRLTIEGQVEAVIFSVDTAPNITSDNNQNYTIEVNI